MKNIENVRLRHLALAALLPLALMACSAAGAQAQTGHRNPDLSRSSHEGMGEAAAAELTDHALRIGVPAPLIRPVGDVLDEAPQLISLNFKDATHYEFCLYSTDGIANAKGQVLWKPIYGGLMEGEPRDAANSHLFHTARSGREEYATTRSSPARLEVFARNKSSDRLKSLGIPAVKKTEALFEIALATSDISNQRMADFVRKIQDYELESACPDEHRLFMMDPAFLGDATFPEGSHLHLELRMPMRTPASVSDYIEALRPHGPSSLPHSGMPDSFQALRRLNLSIDPTAWRALKAALKISQAA